MVLIGTFKFFLNVIVEYNAWTHSATKLKIAGQVCYGFKDHRNYKKTISKRFWLVDSESDVIF